MIEINLLPGSGKKARSDGFNLKALAAQAGARVKDPFMIAAAVTIVAATVSIGYLHVSQSAKADDLTERERRAVQDSTRYVAVLRERNRAESQRDSVRRQLEIIKSIDNDRFIWAHIMDEVSRALPPYTWLKSIQQSAAVAGASTPAPPPPAPPKDGAKGNGKPAPPPPLPAPTSLKFQIAGNTVDIQALTRFMKLLEASPFVQNVQLEKSNLITTGSTQVTEFTLDAEYQTPDSTAIRTVPLTLSVR